MHDGTLAINTVSTFFLVAVVTAFTILMVVTVCGARVSMGLAAEVYANYC